MTTPKKSEKPYIIRFENRKDYLYTYIKGEKDNLEISLAYWTEIAEECKKQKMTRVLVEEDIKEQASIIDIFEHASYVHELGFSNVAVAFVDRHLDQNESNKFAETVALNRGANGRVFESIEEAEKWLLAQ